MTESLVWGILFGLSFAWSAFISVGLVFLLIELKAMQKSTHRIQWMNPLDALGEEAQQFAPPVSEEEQKKHEEQFNTLVQ